MYQHSSNNKEKILINEEEKFFLARMLFPHVDAVDYVDLVTTTKGENECQELKNVRLTLSA